MHNSRGRAGAGTEDNLFNGLDKEIALNVTYKNQFAGVGKMIEGGKGKPEDTTK